MSDNAVERQEFRKTLGQFATGVTVITTVDGDGAPIGVTASSFNSVSMDPPLILWSLAKDALSLPAFQDSGAFNVHVLSIEQDELSNLFAQRGADKFGDLDFRPGVNGMPLLADCAATFQCKTRHQYDGGDHYIFVGEVLACENSDRAPLVYHGGQYAAALPRQDQGATGGDEVDLRQGSFTSDFFIYLLSRAHFQFSHALLQPDAALGLPRAAYYVVAVLCQQGGLDRAEILERIAVTGHSPPEEVFDKLCEMDFVTRSEVETGASGAPARKYTVTDKGREFQVSLLARSMDLEEQVLSGFRPEEVGLFKNMLRRLIEKTDKGLSNMWS